MSRSSGTSPAYHVCRCRGFGPLPLECLAGSARIGGKMAKRGAVGPAAITLIVLDVLLIAALVVIMATWPDVTSSQGTAASTAGPGATGAPEDDGEETTQAEAVEVPDDALEVAAFTMPSGNIWCQLGDDSTQCVIESFDFSPPSLDGSGEDVAGHVWQVTAEQAGPACPGDAVPQ